MQPPVFDDSLRTGFAAIDEQHRLFLTMLAELGAHIEAGHHRQGVIDAFQGMRLYADGHFADEEVLMQQRGYPELEAHKGLHATFMAMAADLEARLGEGAGLLSVETLEFLGSWFIGHIRNEDQRFAAFARG
ncbi:bacteriohemerythrin [Desulfovibrio aerotolerans]|uniref:Bacteriohemerythrin n=1 Tax=Solidesulfovibrio aerotolerans TaxID=295255 RepID=A0A7C9MVJ4_9BACT|nr:bacteriohemerythrin [Solidesulfovibrio aerotolerans]MYL83634.1 bacteriohemerythrin [Solidesulfovibrio aerotolerans]